ncbi:MAG TPA: RHS repeat-associated core domain-containing protein [Acidobacteriota bacterium]|nr:RHS repeat-associated core domain-containing protein [Acidobacteriota bacterium]
MFSKVNVLTAKLIIAGMSLLPACRISDFDQETLGEVPKSEELVWNYSYDRQGNLSEIRSPGGRTLKADHRSIEPGGQVIRVTNNSGPAVEWEVDPAGRRSEMRDAIGKVVYGYDEFDRLASVRRAGLGRIGLQYDSLGRVRRLTVGESFSAENIYDFLGRLSERRTSIGRLQYRYSTAQGQVVRTLPNGVRTIWNFDNDNRLRKLTHVDAENAIIADFQYQYQPDGRIEKIEEWDRFRGKHTIRYGYDELKRLILVDSDQDGATRYDYDSAGNLISVAGPKRPFAKGSHDWAGRLVEWNGFQVQHDEAGNVIAYRADQTFAFDQSSRLVRMSFQGREVEYAYDGDGNLATRIAGGKTRRYLTLAGDEVWRPLMEEGEDGRKAYYLWDGDVPLARVVADEVTYFLPDHLGSARYRVSGSGKVGDPSRFTPFGLPEAESGLEEFLTPGFAGLFYDPSGLFYVTPERSYVPGVGRFLQPDPVHRVPLGSPHDSRYLYAGADPVNYLDRSGRFPLPAFAGIHDWAELVRRQEYATQRMIRERLLQRLKETTGAENAVGSATTQVATSYLLELEGETWRNFSEVSLNAADLYRAHRGLGPASRHMSNLANRRYAAASTLFGMLTDSVQVTTEVLRNAGISAMLINPPHYPISRTPFGWHGTGSLMGGRLRYSDSISTVAPQWWQAGSIEHRRAVRLETDFGSFSEHLHSSTPATSFLERFMMHHFPLGSYFDPASTSSVRTRRINESYRVLTSNGITRVEPAGAGSRLEPSDIGGIYLRSTGNLMEGLGDLRGISVDPESGAVMLLGKSSEFALPSLTVDDLVAVFRCVYRTGEAPFVSIDPDPENPRGPRMLVRLPDELKNTYVGWVLFHADRLMKSYSLGKDNLTRRKITTRIRDYRNLLRADSHAGGEIWERFWIRPAEVRSFRSLSGATTRFEVRLGVQTQTMVLQAGKLAPAENRASSPGAASFSRWFTKRYDEISAEALLLPPAAAGRTQPVPLFAELKRLAVLSAAAEYLHALGTPLPAWMLQHELTPVPVPGTTPSLEVETEPVLLADGTGRAIRVFGGVSLSARKKMNMSRPADPDLAHLESGLRSALEGRPDPGTLLRETSPGDDTAVWWPGTSAAAPLPLRLTETDLSIPLAGPRLRFELRRHYNSFFAPRGVFGAGPWTFDFPFLEKRPRIAAEKGGQMIIQTGYRLSSPLDSVLATFYRTGQVGQVGTHLLVPSQSDSPFLALGAGSHPVTGETTQVVFLRDGRHWHFDKHGRLAAQADPESMVVFSYGQRGRLTEIGVYVDGKRLDRIDFDYDSQGLLTSVESSGRRTKYRYADSLLELVRRDDGETRYQYKNRLVATVTTDDSAGHRFVYNSRAQLTEEILPDGSKRIYSLRRDQSGLTLQVYSPETDQVLERAYYDRAWRPLEYVGQEGARYLWRRNNGAVTLRMKTPQGGFQELGCDGDGSCSWLRGKSSKTEITRDPSGESLEFSRETMPFLRYEFLSDGRPSSLAANNTEVFFNYGRDRRLQGVLFAAPGQDRARLTRWLQLSIEPSGYRTHKISDHSGLTATFQYDQFGLSTVESNRSRLHIARGDEGLPKRIEFPGGSQQVWEFDSLKRLSKVQFISDKGSASMSFDGGRLTTVRDFNGWHAGLEYWRKDHAFKLLRSVRGEGLDLIFDYDGLGRLVRVSNGKRLSWLYEYDHKSRLRRVTLRTRSD